MPSVIVSGNQITAILTNCCAIIVAVAFGASIVHAQSPHIDSHKVVGSKKCVACHGDEQHVWMNTVHYKSFATFHRSHEAKKITERLGIPSVKRSKVCASCHFTVQNRNGRDKIISGVSCESCHGAAEDWLAIHNDYGHGANKHSETPHHRQVRRESSMAQGMRNPSNIYLVASSCLKCHTVPNEKLVNVGHHAAGSEHFEMVSWSQGRQRHNFLRSPTGVNTHSTKAQLRVMYVAGLMADLEFSTRALGRATNNHKYGMTVAKRASNVALKLFNIQKHIRDPNLDKALRAFSFASLSTHNKKQLDSVAQHIRIAGIAFAQGANGDHLSAIDAEIPSKDHYKN